MFAQVAGVMNECQHDVFDYWAWKAAGWQIARF